MSTAAKVGLPETKLGLFPGWGGTVRLSRLCGADTAIEWIAGGEQWSAADALKVGAVDAVGGARPTCARRPSACCRTPPTASSTGRPAARRRRPR